MKVVFSSVLESDFLELVAYFHERGGRTLSVRFEDRVCNLVDLLMEHPQLGRLRQDLKPEGIRSFGIPEFRN